MSNPLILSITLLGSEPIMQTLAHEIEYFKLDKRLSKPELEELQLLEFQKSLGNDLQHLNFSNYAAQKPPKPDFVITRDAKPVELDLVVFAYDLRRRKQSQFSQVKQMFVDEYNNGKLRKFRYFGFRLTFQDDALRNPQKLKPAVLEIIDALDKVENDYESLNRTLQEGFEHPLGYLANPTYWLSDSSRIVSLDMVSYGTFPTTKFMADYGFEVNLEYQENYNLQDIKEILDKAISDHDKEGYDELLIIAGGPNHSGIGNLDEPEAARHFIEWGGTIALPKFLKRVILFNWLHKTIDILYQS